MSQGLLVGNKKKSSEQEKINDEVKIMIGFDSIVEATVKGLLLFVGQLYELSNNRVITDPRTERISSITEKIRGATVMLLYLPSCIKEK